MQRSFPDFVRKCEEKGVLYRAVLPPEQDPSKVIDDLFLCLFVLFTCLLICREWDDLGRVSSLVRVAKKAEARMKELGYTFHWAENDILHMCTPVLPAVSRFCILWFFLFLVIFSDFSRFVWLLVRMV